MRVLDGNGLNGRQHRLQVTRQSTAAPLPGKALVVFDPQRETIEAMVPCQDGHAQERRLLGQIGPLVGAGQVWLADRNFCTEGFFNDLAQRGAYSLQLHSSAIAQTAHQPKSPRPKTKNGATSDVDLLLRPLKVLTQARIIRSGCIPVSFKLHRAESVFTIQTAN